MNKNKIVQINNKFFEFKEKHPFHLVDQSQLPIIVASAVMLLVLNIVFYLHASETSFVRSFDNGMFACAWFLFSSALFVWFITVVRESARGYHTLAVRKGLRYGMVLFIVSEIMFFFAFFWAFFHVSLAPSIAIGGVWPPKSIQSLDVWGLPLVNTLLLLSSGVTITLAHRALLQPNDYGSASKFEKHLLVTIILGVTFLFCQAIEYKYGVTFHWKENIYGSTFFVTTGFHGLHVTIGTIFLLFCLLRNVWYHMMLHHIQTNVDQDAQDLITRIEFADKVLPLPREIFDLEKEKKKILEGAEAFKKRWRSQHWTLLSKGQHVGFEAAAWYWHFVDVVWIFLFITIYWWGS